MSPTLWVSVPPRRARRTAQLGFPFCAAARGPADAQLASSEDQLLFCSPPRVSGPPAFSAKRGKANVRGGCRLGDLSGEAAQAVQERRAWARKGLHPFPRHWTSEPACWGSELPGGQVTVW